MRVRVRSLAAGPMGVCQPGEIHDLPDDIARGLIDGGYGEAVDAPAPVKEPEPVVSEEPDETESAWTETASLETPEVAVVRRGRPKGRG